MPRLRREYLFALAKLCHLGAEQVDRLNYRDFAAYIDDIDAYVAEMKKT